MKKGEGSKKGMESTVEKSLLACTFQHSERPLVTMEETSEAWELCVAL